MACMTEELVSAYLDGELEPGELELIVEHLDACKACLSVFHGVKSVRTRMRTLSPLEPPQTLVDDVGVGEWTTPPPTFRERHVGEALSAYLDGELPTTEVATVTRHVAACAACRFELQQLDSARTAVRSLPRLEPPQTALRPLSSVAPHSDRGRTVTAAAALVGVAAALVWMTLVSGDAATPVDIDRLVTQHNARQTVEAGFSVIPIATPGSGAPFVGLEVNR